MYITHSSVSRVLPVACYSYIARITLSTIAAGYCEYESVQVLMLLSQANAGPPAPQACAVAYSKELLA